MKTFSCLSNLLLLILLVNESPVARGQGGKSVLCQFENKAAVRTQEEARFTPEDLDLSICTHVVYNRAVVGPGLEVVPKDRELDLRVGGGQGLYNRTVALRDIKPGLKVFIDVYDFEGELGKPEVTANRSALIAFTRNAADFVQSHGFDGMNIRITRTTTGFDEVAPILHEEFVRRGLKLLFFIFPQDFHPEVKFEATELFFRNFDLILVGSYWKLPLEHTEILSSLAELEKVVEEYAALGIPPEKMVVAIPAFSISMKICDRAEGGVRSPVCGGGCEGAYAPTELILFQSELRKKIANASEDWIVTRDEMSKVSYGHSKSLQWASFEDPESVRAKAKFILERDLAGVAITNVDMEDFKGEFAKGGETFPLARAAFSALNGEP